MSDIRKVVESMLNGTLVQPPVTFSFSQLHDPAGRPNFSQLLGITRVAPEEPPKKGDESPAPSPAVGPDQPKGNE